MRRKTVKIIYCIFLGILGAIALVVTVSAFPIPGNFKILTVLSGSMEPKIKTGSLVFVLPSANYKPGDVITFKGAGGPKAVPVTHRIVEMKVEHGSPVYVTKGDANNSPDTRQILQNEIIGKELFSVPYFGYAIEVARKPYGFLALIIIPALLIIGDQALTIWREINKKRIAARQSM